MTLPRTYAGTFFLVSLATGLAAMAAGGGGCAPTPVTGAGGSGACLSNPFVCPSNQDCWPNDAVTTFHCTPGPTDKKIADTCDFIGGQVACAPTQVCIVQGSNPGVCTPYCDPNHVCPFMAACQDYKIQGPTGQLFDVHACDAVTIKARAGGSTTSTTATSSSASGG